MIKFYQNIENVKKAGTAIEYTADQLKEYIKCSQDPIYFVENYIWVKHVDRGPIKIKLEDCHRRYIDSIHYNRMTICMASRQIGKSTIACAYAIWFILFKEGMTAAVVANKDKTAKMLMARIKYSYERLPMWLQQGVKEWQKSGIELENDSSIQCYPTSSSGIRGSSVGLLIWDECAFVPANIADEFWASIYPTISSGTQTKVVLSSTPIGYNLFWKLWTEAEQGKNGFKHIRMMWYEVPGRDQAWYDDQAKALGPQKTAQELDCEFLGASDTLIASKTLQSFASIQPKEETPSLKIYEYPQPDHSYVIAVDTARGTGNDSSAFIVFDVTQLPYKVAAVFDDNEVTPQAYPDIIFTTATQYNEAFLLIELNDAGCQVADTLYYDLEYVNVFLSKATTSKNYNKQLSQDGNRTVVGVRTTASVKRQGCSTAKNLIELNQVDVPDAKAISQFSTFVKKQHGYAAESSTHHDDIVMCYVLFGWLTNQAIFRELTDVDRRKLYGNQIDMAMESVVPIKWISNQAPSQFDDVKVVGNDAWLFDKRLQLNPEEDFESEY